MSPNSRNLHGSCNFFLACGCFTDICHTSAHWVYMITTVSGINFIPFSLCLWTQTIPQFCVTGSIIMTLCVGIDRLLSVSMPVSYGRTDKRLVCAGGVTVALLLGSYFYVVSVLFAISDQGNTPVLCVIVNSLSPVAQSEWFAFCVAVNVLDLIVYTTVWLFLRFRAGMSDESKKVFKSLFVIMLTVAFGWLANAFVQAVIVPPFVPVDAQMDVMCYWGIPVNLASASGALTLYLFSKEYRDTFRRLLGLPELKIKNAQAFTTPSVAKSSKS
ncbi:unnamed protein product [Bursaphelenchus okinawaensis]|uniref:G-protein coupled receptors family 1 profile domain-containing protein n=1 Tax=Bursaphelenchus okinawaensis TaxID=465554 RepID=A0A811LL61_9BILA|nr:unnamed protein product [Bursaphelenchus okinawaensis]CAG9123475.1 unnamed protein product [Bursaphelenchus okinawaensis]